jgi:polyisoprenoid-binding protein YceI
MALRSALPLAPIAILLTAVPMGMGAAAQAPRPALAIDSARITLSGASNVHAWTASTTTVRVALARVAAGVEGAALLAKPGALEAFEIAIPAASLTSEKDGLDKNMHKALQVREHADITFRLTRLDAGAGGALKAIGVLRLVGVEREIALDLTVERRDTALRVTGQVALLMTDFGIKPPTAMLGMLKTDPKVTVTFETVLAVPLT